MGHSGKMMIGSLSAWLKRRLLSPVLAELTAGVSPERLAWTVALGVVLGVFPIMGTTTLVCILAGWALRLNQPVLHIAKTLVYPLHLGLILVFIHLGELLFRVPLLSFSIPELMARFKESPMQFAKDFGLAAFHGVVAWAIIAPGAAWLVKCATLPILRRLRNVVNRSGEITC